ncbi:SDR family oxidoreductase [Oxalobacteraceae bacterium CAVE-383]|nr:SDR family oxidoreductase [Oxalobacteraceae bacterium CAVE-383]
MRKVALVTGAAIRTGKIIAEYFSERSNDLVIHYGASGNEANDVVKTIRKRGGNAVALRADLTDEIQIQALIDDTYRQYGRLDVLINCAAFFIQDHFPDITAERLDFAWSVNCRAPILLTKAFYEKAKSAGTTGVVINVIDQKIKGNFHRDHFCYTVGKTAIGNLTQMLAISAAPVLRVNAVFPGLMLPSDNQTPEDFEYAAKRATPLGLIATPEDLAGAIELLLSPAYNGFDFVVDGGQNLVRVTQDVLYEHCAPKKE